jgi:tol-pal system protein YbgF
MKSSIARNSFVVLSLGLALSTAPAVAQNTAPVVDLTGADSVAPKTVKEPSAAVGDGYYQSQMLQNEVRELRGMVEQLSYELQRVKQRQMDDYLDIDRRLSAAMSGVAPADLGANTLGQAGSAPSAEQPLVPVTGPAVTAEPTTDQAAFQVNSQVNSQVSDQTIAQKPVQVVKEPAVNSEEIAENYAQASNLLLKQRDFNGAVLAFKQHVTDYPESPYIANAHYWLGEIYLLQGQDELARQAFSLIVEQYPDHGKALDANFKLGKIYHQLGEVDRARRLLETAAKGAGGAANKAQNYLENNF